MNLEILSKRDASQKLRVSEETAVAWHDRVRGPRDSSGRRLFTPEVIEEISEQREALRQPR